MPRLSRDEVRQQRMDQAASKAGKLAERETPQQTARRLEYTAERLTSAAMMPTTPTHKHKWATGKEKWEAVQRAGRIAAGVEKSGKRGPKPANPMELTSKLMGQVEGYTNLVASGDPDQIAPAIRESLISRVDALAEVIEPADLQLLRAALNM